MIEDFEYYLENEQVVAKSKDLEGAKSLINKARKRIEYIRAQILTEENADFLFEDIYECLREAIQSLMSKDGYKPYSHTVLVAYLKEHTSIPNQDSETFDRLRKIRNNAVYNAQEVSLAECQDALDFLGEFLPTVENEFGKAE